MRYGGVLEGFRDVLAADATVVKLHRLLARRFPGTRTNSAPAAAKLHLVMSVRGTGAHKVTGVHIDGRGYGRLTIARIDRKEIETASFGRYEE